MTIGVEKDKTWLTMEDAELRRIERLSTYLRKDPLLPLPPANSEKLLKLEGLNLPLVHCAFENCGWVSDSRPCLRCIPDDDTQATQVAAGMWRVLPGREQSGHGILGCCGRDTCLKQHIVNCHSEALMESCGKAELQSFLQREKRRGKGRAGGRVETLTLVSGLRIICTCKRLGHLNKGGSQRLQFVFTAMTTTRKQSLSASDKRCLRSV